MIDSFRGKYNFLSNFYGVNVTLDGVTFSSIEHAFQAAKTFDVDERARIQRAESATVAKHAGRTLLHIRPDWEAAKMEIMRELLRQKFSDPDLRARLLATGEEEIVEGNRWHDNFWGSCTCNRCKGRKGENRLGGLLMDLRKELRSV